MTTTTTLDPYAQSLLHEAAQWHALELLFQCPSAEWKQKLKSLRREITAPDVAKAMELAIDGATEGAHHSILGPGGPAPAREVSYREVIQLGYLMSELSTYYDAFEFRPATNEVTDHVSVEAGFMGFLRLKEAYARADGHEEPASIAREAATNFCKEHLSYIAEPLSAILDQSGEPYLEQAGQALFRLAGPREKQIFDILDQETTELEDSIFDCGTS